METARPSDREIEWQLEAQDLRLVLRWIDVVADAADGVTITPGPTVTQVDTYLDTSDRRLERAGYSVRLRRPRGRPSEATLKSLANARADGLQIRLELTEPVQIDDAADVASAPGAVGERVRALVGRRRLEPLFDLQTRRLTFPLAVDGVASGELLLDESAIRDEGGRVLSRLRRVEVEVREDALAAVGPLVERLQQACGLQPAAFGKYEAGLAATGRRRLEPQGFGSTAVEPDGAVGQVALAVLRRHFAKLVAKEPGTRLGDDIEELHDMRVASRRLRAALGLFGDALPVEAVRLRPELAWLGRTIGEVRDLDIQLAQLEEWMRVLPDADRQPLERLRDVLEDERTRARSALLESLDSPRYERLVRRFGSVLRTRSGTRTPPARAAAPSLVERRHRALRKAMKRVRASPDADAYHRLRIAGKRFRYALEFVADVYPGETRRLVQRTTELQDVLGAHQDAQVAVARLRELAAERIDLAPQTAFAMGEIAERNRAASVDIAPRVRAAYRPLTRKRWKRFREHIEAVRPQPDARDDTPPDREGETHV